MREVLVTGSTGLLGTRLVPRLRARGHDVITHSRTTGADLSADLTDMERTFELLSDTLPSVVVNLVGLTSVDQCEEHPNAAYLANTRTIENIVAWIRKMDAPCHIVHISTDQVYDGVGLHAEGRVTLTNTYAFSKYAAELVAGTVASTIFRTNFIGASRTTNRASLTDWIYTSLITEKPIDVFDDVLFCPLSIDTLGDMIHLAIERKSIGIFNLGSKDGMSKADFAFAFARCLQLPTTLMTRCNSSHSGVLRAYRPKDMRMDCSKFETTMQLTLPTLAEQTVLTAAEYHA